ncbi:MAG: hypothetical protein P8Y08_14030 [Desulfobulbaceae bacterium]
MLEQESYFIFKQAKGDGMRAFIEKLQKDTGEIKTFQGIIPICSSCKNIWDDKGYWNHIEAHIREHPQAEFAHYTCPECAKKFIWNLFNN